MKKAYILAGVAILCWSTVATVAKLMLSEINNFQLLWISSLFAGLFLLCFNVFTGRIKALKAYRAKDFLVSVLIGLPSSFLYYVFYYGGTDLMPASQAFIINYMWPIMSVVFACVILKEKLTVRKGVAILISFIGVGIVTGSELFDFNVSIIAGAGLCLMGAVSYGVFTALNQKMDYDNRITMMLSYFTTFAITSVINGVNGDLFVPDAVQTIGFAWNGMFTMAVANTVWVLALRAGETAKISNLAYITPFLSLVWTYLFLGEVPGIYSLIGLVVIVIGIFVQLKDKKDSVN
ncbi:MAG: DMT family transporter [Clostridia bacterium]|nr:DMT family transporter [Clostridia bacterium]